MFVVFRAVLAFFGGIALMLAVPVMLALAAILFAVSVYCAGLLAWAAMDGVLYLLSHDKRILHDCIQAFWCGAMVFGVIVAFFSLLWDGILWAWDRLTRPRYTLEISSPP